MDRGAQGRGQELRLGNQIQEALEHHMARPTKYIDSLADEICDRLSNGESLVAICKAPNMPNPSTVYRWLNANDSFCDMYARAREEQAETLADEIIAISDSCDDAQLGRLRVDARKWVAAKLKPRKYGDKVDLSSSDGTMSPPTVIEIVAAGTDRNPT